MVAELSARHALPKEVVEDVAARTGDGEGRPHPLLPVQYPPWGCPRA